MRELIERLELLSGPFTKPLYRSSSRRALLDVGARAGLSDEELDWLDGAIGGSLDAALKLVPEGKAWRAETAPPDRRDWGHYSAGVTAWDVPYDLPSYGATPALALVIAALKARE